MSQLVCGPWVGEFGWELMSWQAWLRRLSRNHEKIIVCGPEGHEALYEDFCSKYIPHRITGVKDCWHIEKTDRNVFQATSEFLDALGGERLVPQGLVPIEKQSFVIYGDAKKMPAGFDILVHARSRVGKRPQHAWPEPSWDTLVEHLISGGLTVAAIGTESYCPARAADKRNLPLMELMNLIAASRIVVGPSSGPLHLASLCRTPHLVWTDRQWYSAVKATNRERYEKLWNPFQCHCRVLDQYGWTPNYVDVLRTLLEELKMR